MSWYACNVVSWCPVLFTCFLHHSPVHHLVTNPRQVHSVYASSVCRIHVSSEGIHYPRTYIHIHLHPHVSTLVKLGFQFRPRCLIWLQKAVPGAILDHRIVTHVFEGVKQYIYSTKCIFSVFCGRHLHQCCSWSHPISTNCDTCVWSCKAIYISTAQVRVQCFLWKTSPSMLFLEQPWDIWSPSNIDQRPRIIQRAPKHIALIYHRRTNTSKHKSKPTMTR